MSEWKDFLEGLPEDTALAIELTMALETAEKAIMKAGDVVELTGYEFDQIRDNLKRGQEFMSQYVR